MPAARDYTRPDFSAAALVIIDTQDALSGLYDRGITELKNIDVHFLTVADLIYKPN